MNEFERKGIGKVGLSGLLLIISTLVITNVWVYTHLQNTITNQKDSLQSQILDLQSQLDSKSVEITDLHSQIDKLEKLRDLVLNEIFWLTDPFHPFNYEWSGEWNLIATFEGTGETTTETFHVSPPSKRIWRLNWSFTGGEQAYFAFYVMQVVGSEELGIYNIHAGPYEGRTSYFFQEGYFFIKITHAEDVYTWKMVIEQLVWP